ncbi:hypothetical protein DFH08DRAFT_812620 [Mycena albidolilacea]|uniref:Ndc10 domain-containing protein n=1 Tax=Mycena albidolilacea TaxID=1033008 RepID=A0AAD7EM56_9AGAR|nr:hypothetical protein DFH08DRAFT_812620 [Mycena albidolilacea]
MLLTSCSVACRGNNTRSLLLSDLFVMDVMMNAKGLGEIVLEVLPSFYLPIIISATPLLPDFSDTEYGDFGKREWYGFHFFHPGRDPMVEMGYENHRKRVNLIYERNSINISKVTHAGCKFSVKTAREYGASVDGAKALGGWSDSSSFKPCYDRALLVDALLGAAMFDATKPESHFLAREFLGWTELNSFSAELPQELIAQIFPWVEDELVALKDLLLQDDSILYKKYPDSPLFNYSSFNSLVFWKFTTASVARLAEIEAKASLALKNLPQNLVRGFQGAIAGVSLAQRDETRAYIECLESQIQSLTRQFMGQTIGKGKSCSRKAQITPVLIPPPLFSALPPAAIARPAATTFKSTAFDPEMDPFNGINDFTFVLDTSNFAAIRPQRQFTAALCYSWAFYHSFVFVCTDSLLL